MAGVQTCALPIYITFYDMGEIENMMDEFRVDVMANFLGTRVYIHLFWDSLQGISFRTD